MTSGARKLSLLSNPKVSEVKIVLVDDSKLVRAGIRALISAKGDFTVVGEAEDKAQAVDLIARERPDVILLNIDLQTGDGLSMIPDLLVACESSRLAILTSSRDPGVHRQAMSLGAIGVISKKDPPELLTSAITRVHAGGVWLDRFVTAKVLGDVSSSGKRRHVDPEEEKTATLTDREREVIRLVGDGLKNKQIAEKLFISDVTVHHHLTSIYSKLDVKDRLELIIYAYRNRLADLPR